LSPVIQKFRSLPGCWIHDFGLLDPQGRAIDLERVKAKFEDAFAQVWGGAAESDGFNRLVVWADLNWREVACLRAFAKYLRQAGFAYALRGAVVEVTTDSIAETLRELVSPELQQLVDRALRAGS